MDEAGEGDSSAVPFSRPLIPCSNQIFFLDHLDHFRHNPPTSVAALRLLIGIAKLLIAFTEEH